MASAPPPPPLSNRISPPSAPSPPIFGNSLQRQNKPQETKIPIKKNKKTVKLFWKEVRDDAINHVKLKSNLIWDELMPVVVDTQKLEHLFESRAKDLITKVSIDGIHLCTIFKLLDAFHTELVTIQSLFHLKILANYCLWLNYFFEIYITL